MAKFSRIESIVVDQMEKTKVYLSLGGNEGNAFVRLQKALALLSTKSEISELQISNFYRTAPVQVNTLSWFVNAVCSFYTTLSLHDLFNFTQIIEDQLGKVKKPKNAARPIDIDLLFYGCQIHQDPHLEIPHPSWKERLFVLIPLRDLTEEIMVHGYKNKERYIVQDLIQPLLVQSSQVVYLLEKNSQLL